MPEIIIINAAQKAELLPADSSFCHGYALFETLRVDSKRLLFWKAHWDRLKLSAQQLGFKCDYEESEVIAAIRELVQSDNINDGIISRQKRLDFSNNFSSSIFFWFFSSLLLFTLIL